jgi:hypothetical protein
MSEVTTHSYYENLKQLPSPERLFVLTGVAIAAAKKHHKFRGGRNFRNAHFLHLVPLEVTSIDQFDDTKFHAFEHKLAGHIRKIPMTEDVRYNSWSLRLSESIWATHNDISKTEGVRTYYLFEWTEEKATRSERRIGHVPTADRYDMYTMLENFSLADDAASLLDAELEMSAVTAGDCQILQENIEALSARKVLL